MDLIPDTNQAARFLKTLDPQAEKFTFQVFLDDKKVANKKGRILHGSFEELSSKLIRLNNKGYGVFVCINETDLQGRKTENIIRIRAIWQDDDDGFEGEYLLKPSLVVESSPGKYQRYWFTDSDDLGSFNCVLQRLVQDYGSDNGAKGLPRVMRVPGFYHQKDPENPFMSKIVKMNTVLEYDWDTIVAKFPPLISKRKQSISLRTGNATSNFPPLTNFFKYALVFSALRHISPDCSYDIWISVGMALYHESGGSSVGFVCFDCWSRGGFQKEKPSKFIEGETEGKWHSFTSGKGITIGTLYHTAKENGWNGWYDCDETLIQTESEINLELFNNLHGVAMIKSKTLVVRNVPSKLSDGVEREFVSVNDARNFYQNLKIPYIDTDGNVQVRLIFPIWFDSEVRRQYKYGAQFNPVKGLIADHSLYLPEPVNGFLELYTGLAIAPEEGDCSLIIEHIRLYWCHGDDVAFQYTINWMARIFQEPDKPGETAIVLRSGEGTGKNIITDITDEAFGIHGLTMTKSGDITGRFNDHVATCVFICLNEAVWGGDKQGQGTLKALITDKTILCERKYVPKFAVKNCVHLMILSNNNWVAPVGMDDRRYFYLDVSEEKKKDQEYFARLHGLIENGGRAAFVHYLLNLDITDFNPRKMPKSRSETRKENKLRTAGSVAQWWDDVLDNGYIDTPNDESMELISTNDWEKEIDFVVTKGLHDHYLKWCKDHSQRHPEAKTSFSKALNELLGGKSRAKTATHRGFKLPDLASCRRRWEIGLQK